MFMNKAISPLICYLTLCIDSLILTGALSFNFFIFLLLKQILQILVHKNTPDTQIVDETFIKLYLTG